MSVIIQCTDDHRVRIDSHNHILEVRSVAKEGKRAGEEKWTPLGYYSRWDHILDALPEHVLRSEEFASVNDAIERMRECGRQMLARIKK